MKTLILFLITILFTSCYSYNEAQNNYKYFKKNNTYKITQNNSVKKVKVLEVEKDSIKVKYYNYNSDMQTKINIEKISINDIESVKTQKLSFLKTSGLLFSSMATAGFIYYACCFDLNWK